MSDDLPTARVVKIGPAPERVDDFKPGSAFDVSDENPTMLANHMRALQREVHAGFEMITQKLLTAIERLNNRFDDVSSRITDLERWQSRTDARLAALEKKRPSRGRKRK